MLDLTQVEADALLALEKRRVNDEVHPFDVPTGKLEIPLLSSDGREQFHLTLHRGRINLLKGTYQTRARQAVVLARLDFGGGAHRNPDDEVIPCPHLHRYREGFGDKWAEALPASFGSAEDLRGLLDRFLEYCNVTEPPLFAQGLLQ